MGVEVAAGRTRAIAPVGPRGNTFVPPAVALGAAASLGLLLFYAGTIALVQDWGHALAQLADDAPFVAELAAGFGVQVGLLKYIRAVAASVSKAGVAAGAGSSGIAMLACCAHHLTDLLPVVGLSAAAGFLGAYREPLLWVSLAVNAGGVIYLAGQLRKALRAHAPREQAEVCHVP